MGGIRKPKPRMHCWHGVGGMVTTCMTRDNTMTEGVVCCHCGARSTRTSHERHGPLRGHGPHFEATTVFDEPVESDVPCEPERR